jgi:hypothetical protein
VVTDKSTDDKDDHEDDDINKNAKNSQETDINIHHARDKIPRGEHEDDSKDETNNRAIPEDAIVIFRSLVKKAKGNSQDQVQYFKQHDYSLDYGSIASPSPKSFRKSTGVFAGIAGGSFFTMLKKRWIFSHSPVPFPGHEPGNTVFLDRPDILLVRIPVHRFEEVQLFTGFCIAAFPAPRNLFFLAAFPDLAERRAATVPAPLPATELHHGPEKIVTRLVMGKRFPERCIRNGRGNFFIPGIPQLFPEIAGKIGDLPGIRMAVETAEPATGNHLKFLFFHIYRGGVFWVLYFPAEGENELPAPEFRTGRRGFRNSYA